VVVSDRDDAEFKEVLPVHSLNNHGIAPWDQGVKIPEVGQPLSETRVGHVLRALHSHYTVESWLGFEPLNGGCLWIFKERCRAIVAESREEEVEEGEAEDEHTCAWPPSHPGPHSGHTQGESQGKEDMGDEEAGEPFNKCRGVSSCGNEARKA